MAELDVMVAGRSYRLGCEDGQERHLASLAVALDAEARAIAGQTGAMSEAKVLLMTALMVADRLSEAEAALKAAQTALAEATAAPAAADMAALSAAADMAAVSAVLDRLDATLAAAEAEG